MRKTIAAPCRSFLNWTPFHRKGDVYVYDNKIVLNGCLLAETYLDGSIQFYDNGSATPTAKEYINTILELAGHPFRLLPCIQRTRGYSVRWMVYSTIKRFPIMNFVGEIKTTRDGKCTTRHPTGPNYHFPGS